MRSTDEPVGSYLAAVLDRATTSAPPNLPTLDVRIQRGPRPDLDLWVDGDLASEAMPASEAPNRALGAINRWLCFTAGSLVVVHAAVAARGRSATLLIGESGAGKSTLAAGLTRRGWTYVSDEAAGIDEHGEVHPYARPIILRGGVWAEFPELTGRLPFGHERFVADEWHVPPSLLGPVADTPLPVGTVVFVRHGEDRTTRVQAVGRGEALERMTLQNTNLRFWGQTGMDRLAHVVRHSSCYELDFADLGEAVNALEAVG